MNTITDHPFPYLTDRFGNVPYALVYVDGKAVAFTKEEYEQAKAIALVCQCGKCMCCTVHLHVKQHTS